MSLFSMGQQLGQMAANKGLQMAKKPSGGVRRRNETRDQLRGRMDNISSAIDAVFRGVQQTRTKVHKGLSGMPLNPDGTDPGNSFDRFMRQNPHLGGAAQRQAQYDQQARGNMASAVAERKALQGIQTNTPSSKSVVGADGYRSIFDSSGNAVGTTAPVGNGQSMVFDDALGQMVPMSAWSQRKDYVQGTKGMGPTPMQQAANRSVSKPSGMDQIFGGGTKQPSPSGVAGGGVVEPPQPKGAPGGELFGQMPEFRSSGMAMPQRGPVYPPNARPQPRPKLDQTSQSSQSQFMGPEIPSWLLQTPDMPFGETNGTANLRGLFPRLGQGGEEIAALLEDFWNNLSGQPQTAHEQFRRAQQDYARQQYAQGIR